MDLDRLKELIRLFEASDLGEMELEEAGCRIRLAKPGLVPLADTGLTVNGATRVLVEEADIPAAAEEVSAGLTMIRAPMVGVFYAAAEPEGTPFVSAGDAIAEGQVVCVVEAMKLKNEVVANAAGVVEQVLVHNGEPVEYNQPLFAVRRSGD